MSKLYLQNCDIIFISYDEPNAEENWADLLSKIPYAQRVHGVKGSDAAHKAAANLSQTERFITIDGDNRIEKSFVNQLIELNDLIDINHTVFSWPSLNAINGLLYGNGGIKCWPKDLVLNMKTHEHADPTNLRAQVDFCWDINYVALDKSYSTTYNNASPFQAWRAGFREGVKMSLDQGLKVKDLTKLYKGNLDRLQTWMSVGSDVHNGIWSILGARQGCYLTTTEWDYIQVRDFDYLTQFWDEDVKPLSSEDVLKEISELGNLLRDHLPITLLTEDESKAHKQTFVNPKRQPNAVSTHVEEHYDIIMITYDEVNAEENWGRLRAKYPRAMRVDKITGIHQAHVAAAELAKTKMFWAVDGDAQIVDSFRFNYIAEERDQDTVHVWRAINPVNGLEYGYGGVKLLPTALTRNMDLSKPDMTTSISVKYKPVLEVSNITSFNTDPFSAWRSAFRECCKLSSKSIDRQKNSETTSRLEAWCTVAHKDAAFSEFVLRGANEGCRYGQENSDNKPAIKKINNFTWLKEKFNGN